MTHNTTDVPAFAPTAVDGDPPRDPMPRTSRAVKPKGLGRRAWLLALSVVCLWFFVWPALMLGVGAFRTKAPGLPDNSWGFDAFADAYGDPETFQTLLNSLIFATATAAVATALGCAMAFLSTRTRVPLRRLITPVMLVVLVTPALFFSFSWALLGNEQAGMLNTAWRWITQSDGAIVDAYSMPGMILVASLKATAFGYFLLLAPFALMNRSFEEASQIAGAGKGRTFLSIDLPVLAPSVMGVFILQIVLGLEAFDTPLLLGLPADIRVFSSHIYRYLSAESPPGYPQAAALSLLILAIIILLIALERRILRGRSFTTVGGKATPESTWDLGPWTAVASMGIAIYALLAVVLPIAQITLGALQPMFGVTGDLTLDHFRSVLESSRALQAIRTTFVLAICCGLLAVLLALALGYTQRRMDGRIARMLQLSTWIPWALPGVMLALAVAWAYLSIPSFRTMYGTQFVTAAALVVAAIPVAARTVDSSLQMVGRELEEASAIAGMGPVRTLAGVLLPLMARGLAGAWLICGILIAGRLDVPLILAVPGQETISVQAYQMYAQGDSSEAAALLIISALIFAIPCVLWALLKPVARRLYSRIRSA